VREIDRQLAAMEPEEVAPVATARRVTRGGGPATEDGASGRRGAGHPQSCNLEQLYHEALPLSKALSHSGPPAFGDPGTWVSFTFFSHSVPNFDFWVKVCFVLNSCCSAVCLRLLGKYDLLGLFFKALSTAFLFLIMLFLDLFPTGT
jgi:hypothetical protein